MGHVRGGEHSPAGVDAAVRDRLPSSTARAWLFWDEVLGTPDPDRVARALERPGDVWHCGLRLGMGGLPGVIDHVSPTWMHARDAAPGIESTNWRLSLRACLVRTEILRTLGGPRPEFVSLDGAALEMGHRFVRRGAIVRHFPWLLAGDSVEPARDIPFEDQLRWTRYRSGRFWMGWALWRSIATGRVGLTHGLRSAREARTGEAYADPDPFTREPDGSDGGTGDGRPEVAVLIPTIDRYPYLITLLDQLRRQTIPPAEIIVIDQTARDRRVTGLAEQFPDLPLKVFTLDRPGQCSARNLGLRGCRRKFILLLDDDVEIEPNLIESHYNCLVRHGADVVSGVARDIDGSPLLGDFELFRASDVFPAGNTMVRREALLTSGLFDLAYDRGARADADLGTRLYLSGALAVLDPSIVVLHHHAPAGGLRTHGARKITYASSQRSLTQRHLPSPTEIYLGLRYSSSEQVREALWIRIMQTFRVRGGPTRRLAKVVIAAALLPSTVWAVARNVRQARAMTREFPRIGAFDEPAGGGSPGEPGTGALGQPSGDDR
jgi:GT2 family glycosyltransferase